MSAATNQQVALARTHKSSPSHVPKSVRPVVPAFLQKLYEMVNDPKNSELIRWSEAGDSFYVLDHERFAREVLGRWFKHQNFSSFVRQLNMYGFHKIPHLQQGVLKSDSETEFWNFAHANFHQGQPDLLCLIQRKKQGPTQDDGNMDVRESPNNNPSAMATLPSGQVVDIQSIINGITALKRHQTTLSSELNDLKRSNEALWQEALVARERHQKQQDTINRIVKFLAGIFGQHPQHHKDDRVHDSQPSRAVVPRRSSRLIEDHPRSTNAKVEITEVLDEDDGTGTDNTNRGNSPAPMRELMAMTPFTRAYPAIDFTVETPASAPSPTPSDTSDSMSINELPSKTTPVTQTSSFNSSASSNATFSPIITSASQAPATQASYHPSQAQASMVQLQPGQQDSSHSIEPHAIERSITPARAPSGNLDFDLRTALSGLTPAQIQQFLSALSIPQPLTDHLSNPASNSFQTSQIAPYYDYSQFSNAPTSFPLIGSGQEPQLVPPGEGLISFDTGIDQQLKQHWKDTSDIDKDVNSLNTSINSLIQTFGLDPVLMEESHQDEDASALDPSQPPAQMPNTDQQATEAAVKEFNFDSFFNTLTSNNAPTLSNPISLTGAGTYGDMNAPSAFLHEIPANPPTGINTGIIPSVPAPTAGKKRKSDVSELGAQTLDGATATINPAAALLNPNSIAAGVPGAPSTTAPNKSKKRRGQ